MADIESLFRLKRRCRVYNDQTIRLHKKAFEVPGCLPGGRITVYYMPWDLCRIYYGDDLKLAKPVDLTANAYRFENANRLSCAQAHKELFEPDAITLIATHCHGNRRQIMNLATLLPSEAFYRNENCVSAQLFTEQIEMFVLEFLSDCTAILNLLICKSKKYLKILNRFKSG